MPEPDDSIPDPFQLCGTTIEGKVRIASVVGDGGFGVVYRGVHQGFGELVAVKCLKVPQALPPADRANFLERLRDEGRLLHRLSKATSGIVQALDVGAVSTPSGAWVPYLVLEWLDGETLAEALEKRQSRGEGPLPPDEAIRLLAPAARALAVAHAHKVAHRDVKPQNLFIAKVGNEHTLKVLDFGIAKVFHEDQGVTSALHATGVAPAVFTPRYGAPEQFNKQRGASGPWTDVFALGLILVELLTGKTALEGDDPTQLYIAAADPTRRPTPRERGAPVSTELERVIEKALAVEPRDRYVDAGELLDALLATMRNPGGANMSLGVRPSPGRSPNPDERSGSLATIPLEARTLGPSRVVVNPTEPITALPDAQPNDPGRTVASPGVAPPPGLDPMSKTPFFHRHRLPPNPSAMRNEMPAAPSQPAPRLHTRWMLAALGVLAVSAAATSMLRNHTPDAQSTTAISASAGAAAKRNPGSRRPDARPLRAASSASTASNASSTGSAEPATTPTDMVFIPPATLTMRPDAREVSVRGFYLDRAEVSVHAYEGCLRKRMCGAADHVALPPSAIQHWWTGGDADANEPTPPPSEYTDTWTRRCNAPRGLGAHPINCVDFASAEAYCRWAGKRLPTEAEWELATRGTQGRPYPWGDSAPSCQSACYDKNGGCLQRGESVSTCPSGKTPGDRTPEGVLDLAGNVSEWVRDGSGDPTARVARGASFIDTDDRLNATYRLELPASAAHVAIGFRCAKEAP